MKISNEIRTRTIEIIKRESEKDHYPSCQIEIKINTENIGGYYHKSIWLSEDDIDRFLIDLETLDKLRKGQANLSSMSPEEFNLTLKSIDNYGHLSVMVRLIKDDRMNNDFSFDIKVVFQIDPSDLKTIINDIARLKE